MFEAKKGDWNVNLYKYESQSNTLCKSVYDSWVTQYDTVYMCDITHLVLRDALVYVDTCSDTNKLVSH